MNAVEGAVDFEASDIGSAVDHLALQVGRIHTVVVNYPHAPHAGRREVEEHRSAQTPSAHDADPSVT